MAKTEDQISKSKTQYMGPNVLSVDVEDYFHVEAFAANVSPRDWGAFLFRVEENVIRILTLFEKFKTKATFYVLGWVAEKCPSIVPSIMAGGHEIGCHGYGHQHLSKLTPQQFRDDIRKSRQILIDQSQSEIVCYRAPTFSIMESTLWALDILAEEGFFYDSSVFPGVHDLYGVTNASRFPHWLKTTTGYRLLEFPPSTIRLFENNYGMCGGGYLRIFPYFINRWALRQLNLQYAVPAMVYFHPWEIDPRQPRIKAGWRSQFRHYTNLAKMERKIERLLGEFSFSTFSETVAWLEVHQFPLPIRKI